jgi:transcriptional regulator with XRE-family HTH domain
MNRLREIRVRQDMSQGILATLSGVSLRTIGRIESGMPASERTMERLAKALQVPIEDLEDPTN